jgi:hypothetical protein
MESVATLYNQPSRTAVHANGEAGRGFLGVLPVTHYADKLKQTLELVQRYIGKA